jgi:prepilin-type N-terminal cleavage/methylation domain-containing protein
MTNMNFIEQRRRMRGQGGFTLIELLVVIAILGILAGVVVFSIGSIRQNAAENACQTELGTFETAADAASLTTDEGTADYLKTAAGKYFTADASPDLTFTDNGDLPTECQAQFDAYVVPTRN